MGGDGMRMKALSLFTGIGGLDLAAELCGIETAAFCEIEPYAVKVLERRWPGVPIIDDVRKIRGCDWAVDVIHGGFPCQDLSQAGKQAGLEGERSGLWFEMLRVISEIRPAYVVAENVRGAINLALDTVQAGMEAEGYPVRTLLLPAAAFGAPHKRERMFVIGIRKDVADRLCLGSEAGIPRQNARKEGESNLSDYIGEDGGSLCPTPTSTERSGINPHTGRGGGLSNAVSLWPTPHRNCSNGAGAHGDGGLNIQTAVSLWPTPRANKPEGYPSNGYSPTLAQRVTGEVRPAHGMLSPDWVECLMNYPLGWTDLEVDEPSEWVGWPALLGQEQYPYEPPRTVAGCPNRAKRLKCLGNAVVPAQARPIFEAIRIMEEVTE